MPCFLFSFTPSPQSILCISTFISRCYCSETEKLRNPQQHSTLTVLRKGKNFFSIFSLNLSFSFKPFPPVLLGKKQIPHPEKNCYLKYGIFIIHKIIYVYNLLSLY